MGGKLGINNRAMGLQKTALSETPKTAGCIVLTYCSRYLCNANTLSAYDVSLSIWDAGLTRVALGAF